MGQGRIGKAGVGPVALGGANGSLLEVDPARVEATVDEALAFGVTLIDTALVYTKAGVECHNERLIASLLAARGGDGVAPAATRGGHSRGGDEFPVDGRPETILRHCEMSLNALGVDCIALYQLHVPD